jgi:hypothetical protein
MDWLVHGGSLAGVLALALVAWLLGLGGSVIGDEDMAKRAAEEAQTGFVAEAAFVSTDGKAALVRGSDGTFVLLKTHGAQLAARRIEALRLATSADGVTIASGERMFGDVRLKLPRRERDKLLTMV